MTIQLEQDPLCEVSVKQLIAEAREWLRTPYAHQGRKQHVGVDCIGLILGVVKNLGIGDYDRPEYRRYPRVPRDNKIIEMFSRFCVRAYRPQAGDILVCWSSEKMKLAHHVAFLSESGTLIHTYVAAGSVVEEEFDDEWREKVMAVFKTPGVY